MKTLILNYAPRLNIIIYNDIFIYINKHQIRFNPFNKLDKCFNRRVQFFVNLID